MDIFGSPAGFNGLAGRNLLRNGNGAINQRAVSGTVTLAAGAYGHDGFKAGANGCTYTFATSGADTVFTIAAGSLIQVIEPANVFATAVWLGWFGTSTARIWQGNASGAFVAGAPISMRTGLINTLLVTGLSLATATAVEFGTGTLGYVQVEEAIPGLGPTAFERRSIGDEQALCLRYYWPYVPPNNQDLFFVIGSGDNYLGWRTNTPVYMRAAPTVLVNAMTNGTFTSGCPFVSMSSPTCIYVRGDVTTVGSFANLTSLTASAEL